MPNKTIETGPPEQVRATAEEEWTVIQETPTMANLMCGNVELAHMPREAAAEVVTAHKAALQTLRDEIAKLKREASLRACSKCGVVHWGECDSVVLAGVIRGPHETVYST